MPSRGPCFVRCRRLKVSRIERHRELLVVDPLRSYWPTMVRSCQSCGITVTQPSRARILSCESLLCKVSSTPWRESYPEPTATLARSSQKSRAGMRSSSHRLRCICRCRSSQHTFHLQEVAMSTMTRSMRKYTRRSTRPTRVVASRWVIYRTYVWV